MMTFSVALTYIKQGKKLTRKGWNGPGKYIALFQATKDSEMSLPYLFIRTVQGHTVPWLASQTDLLAEDWDIA